MPRPTKPRRVEFLPDVTYFKPAGVPMSDLDEVSLGVDEAEALRLKDLVGLEQEECASRMNLAQSTFQRILTSARHKVSEALIEGKAIRIEGGNYMIIPRSFVCGKCRREWINKNRSASQPVCPECGSANVQPFETQTNGELQYPHSRQKPRGSRRRHGHRRGNTN